MSGRRSFLASAAASVVAGVTVPTSKGDAMQLPPSAQQRSGDTRDAVLLALCEQFHKAQAAVVALLGTDEDLDDVMLARYAISDQIIELVPRTLEGLREMARVALVMTDESDRADDPDADVRFAAAVIRALAETTP